jgi:glycine/D-amino acid oxidase-like deaminating enzyme
MAGPLTGAGRPERVEQQARAQRHAWPGRRQSGTACGSRRGDDSIATAHCSFTRSVDSFNKVRRAWDLRARNGVTWEELDAAGLRQFEPSLSSNCAHGILVRANGHTSNPHALVTRLAAHLVGHGATIYACYSPSDCSAA